MSRPVVYLASLALSKAHSHVMAEGDAKADAAGPEAAAAAAAGEAREAPDASKEAPAAAAPADAAPETAATPAEAAAGEEDAAKGEKKAKAKRGEGKAKAEKGEKKGKGKGKGKGQVLEQFNGPLGSGTGYRLNVKNLGLDMTNEQLGALFEPFGKVLAAHVKTYNDGTSRGFGYVILPGEEEANLAIKEVNGKEVGGDRPGGTALYVAPAERRATPAEALPVDVSKGKGKGKGGKAGKGKGKDHQAAMNQNYMYQQQIAYAQAQQYFLSLQLAAAYNFQQQQLQQSGGKGAQAGAAQMPYGMMGSSTEYEGSIKSLYPNRHGFIVCAETFKKYGRDVYFDKTTLPEGAKIADRLRFTVTLNEKSHPRVVSAKLVYINPEQPEAE